ncbi:hypothetical protein JXA80_08950 [bacterium]|nr:hypothetical protein [candidate division CSSED10-310 bacterium]
MNEMNPQPARIKDRIKSFSDSMFRNYQIMKKRWEISNSEKKRAAEIAHLGNTVFRLYRKEGLSPEKIEPQIKKIEQLENEIKVLEEKLRDIIMKADLPRQLQAGNLHPPPVPRETDRRASMPVPGKPKTDPVDNVPVKPMVEPPTPVSPVTETASVGEGDDAKNGGTGPVPKVKKPVVKAPVKEEKA